MLRTLCKTFFVTLIMIPTITLANEVDQLTDQMTPETFKQGKVCPEGAEVIVLKVKKIEKNYLKGYVVLNYKEGSNICERLSNWNAAELLDFIRQGKKKNLFTEGLLGGFVTKVKVLSDAFGAIVHRGFDKIGFKAQSENGLFNFGPNHLLSLESPGHIYTAKSQGDPNFIYSEYARKETFSGALPSGVVTSKFGVHVAEVVFNDPNDHRGYDLIIDDNKNTGHQVAVTTSWNEEGLQDLLVFSSNDEQLDITPYMSAIRTLTGGYIAYFTNLSE